MDRITGYKYHIYGIETPQKEKNFLLAINSVSQELWANELREPEDLWGNHKEDFIKISDN